MIEKIKSALSELDDKVLYGICKKGKDDTWDCLVIRKERLAKGKTSNLADCHYVSVRVVREDVIPEGFEHEVIRKMKTAGFKRSEKDITYEYTMDANEIMVEIATIEFVKPTKGECYAV